MIVDVWSGTLSVAYTATLMLINFLVKLFHDMTRNLWYHIYRPPLGNKGLYSESCFDTSLLAAAFREKNSFAPVSKSLQPHFNQHVHDSALDRLLADPHALAAIKQNSTTAPTLSLVYAINLAQNQSFPASCLNHGLPKPVPKDKTNTTLKEVHDRISSLSPRKGLPDAPVTFKYLLPFKEGLVLVGFSKAVPSVLCFYVYATTAGPIGNSRAGRGKVSSAGRRTGAGVKGRGGGGRRGGGRGGRGGGRGGRANKNFVPGGDGGDGGDGGTGDSGDSGEDASGEPVRSNEWMEHQAGRSCQPVPKPENLIPDEIRALNELEFGHIGDAEKWYTMWDLLFEGHTRPDSPYMDRGIGEIRFRKHCLP
ncbi:hypothetical protein ISF_01278 [Cordyceps fumosorosea ARSEF 2679]|uniref:Uncharacterized protein n=1 Tax=Cordyceps fumosorosea (strain ARSEF 2679) TaxID=1081104 RepID=A0A168D5V0_CORFA|nr:hypothetical protein ISF_01278 [Cordyceps fumosorosea ARSEF 2679]OAA72205.1 hypothetical protein ISF_01278 [Cordyceps fumosorosea ARSEF 2679]